MTKRRKKHKKLKQIVDGYVLPKTEDDPNVTRLMNDQCRHMFECRNAVFEWNCFGKYKQCIRYTTGDLSLPVKSWDWYEMAHGNKY